MLAGISNSISKVIFCWEITRNFSDFFDLLQHSKMFRRSRNKQAPQSVEDRYKLKILENEMDFTLRRYSGDLDMFFEVFWEETYSCPGVDPRSINTIIDLGANIGMASAYFQSCFPKANLYCIEPDPDNYSLLVRNLQSFLPKEQLQVLQVAIGPAGQKGSIVSSRFTYNHTVQFDNNSGQIDVMDMDAIFTHFNLHGADLIKIDIEGAETFLFENTDWLNKVNYIFIEFHSQEVKENAMESFRLNGFTCKVSEDNPMLLFAAREKIQTFS